MEKKLQQFCILAGANGDFRQLCRRLGVSPDDMNELLLRELGVDGDEYLAALQGQEQPPAWLSARCEKKEKREEATNPCAAGLMKAARRLTGGSMTKKEDDRKS
ncbi:MAG: hypothetical protein J5871_02805 [Bacteroidales bacterium]|nr:hypothetical protein [Bacteroidales bacterium]